MCTSHSLYIQALNAKVDADRYNLGLRIYLWLVNRNSEICLPKKRKYLTGEEHHSSESYAEIGRWE